jgi:hypothetical protein
MTNNPCKLLMPVIYLVGIAKTARQERGLQNV